MTGLTILVTGVTRYIGSALAGRLAADPAVVRVIGVDAALPDPAARARMGDAEFARADIRNPLIARVIDAAGVDTVVHASASATPASSAARTMAKEMNVLGTMQLLGACQRSATVANLIVRSTGTIYGVSSRHPAVLTEDTPARSVSASGPARDAVDIEGYVRGFSRRRPDVRVAVPRFTEIVGPTVRTPVTKYFSLQPIIPVAAGRDARLQFVHERDVVALILNLALGDFAGIVNVAGSGILTLSQAIHRAGRVPLTVPSSALDALGRLLRLTRLGDFSPEVARRLSSDAVLDTSRLINDVGFIPEFTTMGAFDDFAATIGRGINPPLARGFDLAQQRGLGIRPQAPAASATGSATTPSSPKLALAEGLSTSGRPARVRPRVSRARTSWPRPRLVSVDALPSRPGQKSGPKP